MHSYIYAGRLRQYVHYLALAGVFIYASYVRWAWHAKVSEKHTEEQLMIINFFFEEQAIVNEIVYDKLISIEKQIDETSASQEKSDSYVGEYVLLRDDEDTEPMTPARTTKE
jgi:hypothetical protein